MSLVPIDAAGERSRFGGKAANLAFLAREGFTVPEAAVVPVEVFDAHLASCRAEGGAGDLAPRVVARELPALLAEELRSFVQNAGGRVSVRSSANLEDAKTHSFAGQFLTVLDVGPDAVAEAVRRVWASTLTENVSAYLRRAGLDPALLKMAVVVQRQIDSRASGVAMGDRARASIEAVLGQGEALVGAEVEADHWEVKAGRIVSARIADKAFCRKLPAGAPSGTLERTAVPEVERLRPSLSESEVLVVADACARIAEARKGLPQDCEFAFVEGKLHVLQTRDVTASLPVEAPPLAPFTPPGKGSWEIDASHFSRPCTRLFQERFPPSMKEGFSGATERYGALLSHVDIAFVNGFTYGRARPVAAPEDAASKAPPPPFVFKLLCKLVPAIRRRLKNAELVWQRKEWRVQLGEWEQAKARSIAKHLRLQSVDLGSLTDARLAAHLREVYAHAGDMVAQHHTYNLATMLPTGDLLAHLHRWTDGRLSDAETFALLAGATPASADLSSSEARRFGQAMAADAEARRLLCLDEPREALDDGAARAALAALRALPGSAGETARDFLAHRELRLVEGLDPGEPCFRELPSLLWRALRTAARLAGEPAPSHAEADAAAVARCRDAVPAAHRAEFDALLEEARAVLFLRDERALYSDVWAWGILRTVVLHVGERVKARAPGLLVEASDIVHAGIDEIESLLLHSRGPSAVELEGRAAFRRAYTTDDAPPVLGVAPAPPPSPDLLPPGAARVMAALMGAIGAMGTPRGKNDDEQRTLRGRGASSGAYEGVAHVVNSHADLHTLTPGAVLVVGAGASSFNMLAPLASAVVAEGGGMLSHVAIVCREYRIPCVCGCPGALSKITTGQRLRVDGTRGLVELL